MHDSWECNDMCSLDWKQMQPKRVSPLLQMILECKTVSPWSFSNLSSHQVVLESLVPATQSASRQNSIPAELRQWAYPLTQTWGYGDGSRSRVNGVHLPLSDNINARYDDTQNHLAMARHASCVLCHDCNDFRCWNWRKLCGVVRRHGLRVGNASSQNEKSQTLRH